MMELNNNHILNRGCTQKFPDSVDNETYAYNNKHSVKKEHKVMAAKLTRLTHKIAILLHLEAESCTICSSCSRWPLQKLLDTLLYITLMSSVL